MSILARLPRIAVRPTISVSSCRHYNNPRFDKFLQFVKFSPEIQDALAKKAPIVALESSIISHPETTYGLPRPDNVEYAARAEQAVRKAGAIPATISIINGIIYVGMMQAFFGPLSTFNSSKVSRRDMPYVLGMGRLSGGCTIAATMAIAEMVGIKVLVAGGIGGVHQSAPLMMDISADLGELGRTNVAVICSGPRPYLDVTGTLEFLETRGVPVATFRSGQSERRESAESDPVISFRSSQTGRRIGAGGSPAVPSMPGQMEGLPKDQIEGQPKGQVGATVTVGVAEATATAETMLPAFYSREGRCASPLVIEDAKEAAKIIYASHSLGLECGQLFCNPIPWDFELDIRAVEKAVRIVFKMARKKNKRNKENIENIISHIRRFSSVRRGGAVLAERALLLNNAVMGAQIAIELSKLEGGPGRVETTVRPLPSINHKRQAPITYGEEFGHRAKTGARSGDRPSGPEREPKESRIQIPEPPSVVGRQPPPIEIANFRQKIAKKIIKKKTGFNRGRGQK